MTRFIIAFLIACLAVGCKNEFTVDKDTVNGKWQLFQIAALDGKSADIGEEANMQKLVADGKIICFFKDGTCSVIDGNVGYSKGRWKYNDKPGSITLLNEDQSSELVSLNIEKDLNRDSRYILEVVKGPKVYRYVKTAMPLVKQEDDPFYRNNYEWGVKAERKETRDKLGDRLANYFRHLALILKATKERKEDVVSFQFSQGPVKIYNGAIGIYEYQIVPQSWKNTFFNDSSAHAAYDYYRKYLETSHYGGAGVKDWVEDDYGILLSIYADFNKSDTGK